MRRFLRDYGVALILIVIGIAGYLGYQAYKPEIKENVLAYSLDVIGARLVDLVEDPASKQAIAQRFDQFKQQVLDEQVRPEEVESVAANVLNLSHSGSTLTPEQAEMMLDLAVTPEPAALPEPGASPDAAPPSGPMLTAPSPPGPPPPGDLAALGDRLGAMLAFETQLHDVMRQAGTHAADLAAHVQFRFEEGLHVNIDTVLVASIGRQEYERLADELKHLERKRMVVWKAHVAAEAKAERERARRDAQSIAVVRRRQQEQAPVVAHSLASLEAMKELEAKGFRMRVHPDSLRQLIQVQVKTALSAAGAEAKAEQLEALEAYMEELEDALEDAMEAREDAIEAALEAHEEARAEREATRVRVQQAPAPQNEPRR